MPRPDRDKMEQLNVRMPRDLADQLKQRAEEEDRTLAHTVRRVVKLYLAETGPELSRDIAP